MVAPLDLHRRREPHAVELKQDEIDSSVLLGKKNLMLTLSRV